LEAAHLNQTRAVIQFRTRNRDIWAEEYVRNYYLNELNKPYLNLLVIFRPHSGLVNICHGFTRISTDDVPCQLFRIRENPWLLLRLRATVAPCDVSGDL
jgi:hypothetical protein